MDDVRWFAPNAYTGLLIPELRRRGLTIALEGENPARLALAMSGTRAADGWRYAQSRGCPLVVYLWDLHPHATSVGVADPVWWVAGRFVRLPRPFGGFRGRRGYYSRLRYIAARAQEVWVPSEHTQISLRDRFDLPSRRVPYCYDSNRFRPRAAPRDHPPTLLTVSRLQGYKNQAATIMAATRLAPAVQVRLIGRGPERDSLQRLADSRGVRCHIDTEADDQTVADAYLQASVAVCPSRFEGFGLTPVEAVASGTPTVASAIPTHREFVGSAARLFPLDNLDALTEAVRAALSDLPPDPGSIRDLTIPAAAERFLGLLRPLLG